ncbi:MAG TPA: hypothetical protein VFV68_01485 [Agriterribacter sp.]|nr:hypothetical protein [Agriterribacter sp.]
MRLFKKIIPFLFILISLAFITKFDKAVGEKPPTHSFFMAGPEFTGIIGEKGEAIWNAGKAGARDGYVLPNGNILICWSDEVKEFNSKKEVVFTYPRKTDDMELGTALRLANGNTMITESGKAPRIVEVDKTGKVISATPIQPETDNTHMQTRMARKLKNGNYLVPHLLAFAVKEYDPMGNIVHVFKTDLNELGGRQAENWPFTAIRLDNGNTLTTLTHGNKIIEFDKAGKIVWKVTNDDIAEHPFQDPCGAQRLPNGNTVIASYGAKEGTIKLFEISRDKKLVWTYAGYNVHHFQVLTTNGLPVQGEPLK